MPVLIATVVGGKVVLFYNHKVLLSFYVFFDFSTFKSSQTKQCFEMFESQKTRKTKANLLRYLLVLQNVAAYFLHYPLCWHQFQVNAERAPKSSSNWLSKCRTMPSTNEKKKQWRHVRKCVNGTSERLKLNVWWSILLRRYVTAKHRKAQRLKWLMINLE